MKSKMNRPVFIAAPVEVVGEADDTVFETYDNNQAHHCFLIAVSIHRLITLHTQTLVENRILETSERAHAQHFGRHGCTNFQRDRNFADGEPFYSVNSFDHHSTPAFPIVFATAIPKAFNRRLQRCPVISLLIVFTKSSIFEIGFAIFIFHHCCKVFF